MATMPANRCAVAGLHLIARNVARTAPAASRCPLILTRASATRQYATQTQPETRYQDILKNPHPTPRPENIAYFTGNPRYYQNIMLLNTLIRKHHLSFADRIQYESIPTRPRWMSMLEMQEFLEFKLVKGSYDELIHKLNILYTVQAKDPEVYQLLSKFVKPGAALVTQVRTQPGLDEFGRSYSYGSRKTARAQAWMVEGDGQIYVNGTHIADYFAEDIDREQVIRPLELAGALGQFNVWALVKGGGPSGQAAAAAVAVARGLVIHDPLLESAMKETGFTVIDTRQVERKKTGQPKARKKNTWVKR